MGRLTQKTESGKWQVKGLPWEKLRKGETITEETRQLLYGCLCKLMDYEDTGMSPTQLRNWWDDLKDTAAHVCDDLCRYHQDTKTQEEMDELCENCKVSACMIKPSETEKTERCYEVRLNKALTKKGMNLRLVSADAVKEIICKYENRRIQRTMVFEIEKLNGCLATPDQVLEVLGCADMEFEEWIGRKKWNMN